jgi:membrane associated rhomboid family serine protease
MQDLNAPPLNPLPPIVWILALPLVAMELVLQAGQYGLAGGPAIGWRIEALERFAFFAEIQREMLAQGRYPLDHVLRVFSYPLVHGSGGHTLFVIVILLALGKMVGEAFRWWSVLAIVLAATLAGAVAITVFGSANAVLFGGYPPVYGLIGGFSFLLWGRLRANGGNQIRAFQLVGFLLAVQIAFGAIFGGGQEWIADLAGFVAGFLLSFIVSPGGWTALRNRLRQR